MVVEALDGLEGVGMPSMGGGEVGEERGEITREARFPVYEGAVAVKGEGTEGGEVGGCWGHFVFVVCGWFAEERSYVLRYV